MLSKSNRCIKIEVNAMNSYLAYDDISGLRHAKRLVKMAETESEIIVAWCHDLVEDGYALPYDLKQWGLTDEELDAVEYLTHLDNETYEDYIDNIIQLFDYPDGQLAMQVKFYDLVDHMNPKGICKKHASKLERYFPAFEKIVRKASEKEAGW